MSYQAEGQDNENTKIFLLKDPKPVHNEGDNMEHCYVLTSESIQSWLSIYVACPSGW